jgi:hypothetical protein
MSNQNHPFFDHSANFVVPEQLETPLPRAVYSGKIPLSIADGELND